MPQYKSQLKINSPDLLHITLAMLALPHTNHKEMCKSVMKDLEKQANELLKN